MESFEKVYEIVKSKLSEKRFYHSVCTMERCVEYAKIYGIDEEVAKLVGIAHDIVKETPKDVCLKVSLEYFICICSGLISDMVYIFPSFIRI